MCLDGHVLSQDVPFILLLGKWEYTSIQIYIYTVCSKQMPGIVVPPPPQNPRSAALCRRQQLPHPAPPTYRILHRNYHTGGILEAIHGGQHYMHTTHNEERCNVLHLVLPPDLLLCHYTI